MSPETISIIRDPSPLSRIMYKTIRNLIFFFSKMTFYGQVSPIKVSHWLFSNHPCKYENTIKAASCIGYYKFTYNLITRWNGVSC